MQTQAKYFLASIVALATLTACSGGGGGGGGGDTPPPPPQTSNCTTPVANGNLFTQNSQALGLCYVVDESVASQEIHVMGGGLAMSDVDNDGLQDLYVVHGRHDEGRLYLNDGTKFVSAPGNNGIDLTGLDNAAYFVDINGDGWDDFISIQYRTNYVEIFINDQTGNFDEATASTGIYLSKPTYSLAAADYDLDGDLDLFFAHWGIPWATPNEPITQYLWENDGAGAFTDVSDIVEVKASLRPPPIDDVFYEHSFTPIFADVNSDRFPDILLASDYTGSQVLINNSGLSFSDATTDAISDENGMGAAVADYDNDGDLDWFVSSIYFRGREEDKEYVGGITGNRLYANDGSGVFTDVTETSGIRDGAWGWGACFEDFDNDGHVDIFHTNGMISILSIEGDETDPFYPYHDDRSRLFLSQGDGTFAERSILAGMNHVDQGRGIICSDFDNDGGVDIIVATNGKSPTAYRNTANNGNHYIQVDLEGPAGNSKGIGARIIVETSNGTQMREVVMGSNYLSQQPATLHFGLGDATSVTALTVTWPGIAGIETRLENLDVDQRLTVQSP